MKFKIWCLLLLVFISLPVVADIRLPATPGHWALVIGNAAYESVPLRYTIADALLMDEVLEKAGFQTTKILEATYCQTTQAFADLANRLAMERDKNPGIEQLVDIYYSGHGATMKDMSGDESDGLDGALVPVDWKQDSGHMIPDDILNAWLDQLGVNTKVVVILDCGNMGAEGLAASGRLILAASLKSQCTYGDGALAHGVFTYYLVDGLRKGEKDADGKISLQAAFRYAQEQAREFMKNKFRSDTEAEMTDGIGQPVFLFDDPTSCPTLPAPEEAGNARAK